MDIWRIPLSLVLAIFGIVGAALFGGAGINAIGAGISVMLGQSYSEFAGWFLTLLGLIMLAPPIICCIAIAALWGMIPRRKKWF